MNRTRVHIDVEVGPLAEARVTPMREGVALAFTGDGADITLHVDDAVADQLHAALARARLRASA